ncbi:hypothetical protein pdam_00000483 [Pocillopora damicornis]|uniref:Uncharacterized protein n=1 Tax=Pocillopora damicornis TaxID=46731 RepID=A0A3M6UJH6_POCDA|nr:hypothetical protein pdam_00000483 [Pocillopora damicornis]
MKHLKNKCHELETRKDQWRDKFGKCNRNKSFDYHGFSAKEWLNGSGRVDGMLQRMADASNFNENSEMDD